MKPTNYFFLILAAMLATCVIVDASLNISYAFERCSWDTDVPPDIKDIDGDISGRVIDFDDPIIGIPPKEPCPECECIDRYGEVMKGQKECRLGSIRCPTDLIEVEKNSCLFEDGRPVSDDLDNPSCAVRVEKLITRPDGQCEPNKNGKCEYVQKKSNVYYVNVRSCEPCWYTVWTKVPYKELFCQPTANGFDKMPLPQPPAGYTCETELKPGRDGYRVENDCVYVPGTPESNPDCTGSCRKVTIKWNGEYPGKCEDQTPAEEGECVPKIHP